MLCSLAYLVNHSSSWSVVGFGLGVGVREGVGVGFGVGVGEGVGVGDGVGAGGVGNGVGSIYVKLSASGLINCGAAKIWIAVKHENREIKKVSNQICRGFINFPA